DDFVGRGRRTHESDENDRPREPQETHAARLHGHELAVRRKTRESHQDTEENGNWNRQAERLREQREQDAKDDCPRHALRNQRFGLLEDRRDLEDECENHQRQEEGQHDLAYDIAIEDADHEICICPTRLALVTRVAFLWHMHQPYYEDLVTREHILPWVRLHALKDYYGMVALLREFPDVRMTFNLVPSLLAQLEAFAGSRARDRSLDLSLKAADNLDGDEVTFILQNFFHAQRQRLIDVHP